MPNLVLPNGKEKFWITFIKRRIKKNKNFLGFVSGETGAGKSWSSLSIGEDLDPNFNIDQIVFDGLELMNLINSNTLSKGSVIVFEEAGVGLSSRVWQSTTNRMINFLLQTFRHRNFILLFNSPYMDFVDASTRRLFHAEFKLMGIDFKKKQARINAQMLQYNSRQQKFYYHLLRVIQPMGCIPVTVWRVDKPSQNLIDQYEIKKRQYTDRLNKDIHAELTKVHDKKAKKKDLTDIQQGVLDMIKSGLTVPQMSAKLDRAESSIRTCMEYIRKKGYQIHPVYDKDQHKRILRYRVENPPIIEKKRIYGEKTTV